MVWWNPLSWGGRGSYGGREPEPPPRKKPAPTAPPPPAPLDPETERDFLFDIRTGYEVLHKEVGHFDDHPLGEGNPEIFHILRAKLQDIPSQWEFAQEVDPESGIGSEVRRRIRKLDLEFFLRYAKPKNRIKSGLLSNVYRFRARFLAGSDADFRKERSKYDDRKNTLRSVGTGFPFATISGSMVPAASGDGSVVYPNATNTYTENITDNALNAYQIVADVAAGNQAITITAAAGTVITVSSNHGWLIENFEIDGQGTATTGVFLTGANNCLVARCIVHDFTTYGIRFTNVLSEAANCLCYNCGDSGFFSSGALPRCKHCTAVDNTTGGFRGNGALNFALSACLASDNGTDYINATGIYCAWNVSSDLTAPGSGVRTGFLNANFVNYAGDDFRLAAAGENGANIDGWPVVDVDFLLNRRRKDSLLFYAGFHDPDPVRAGTPPRVHVTTKVPWVT